MINGAYFGGRVVQSFTVPNDGSNYIADMEIYGNPEITVTITHTNGTTETLTWEEFRGMTLEPGSTITITSVSDTGEGIGEVQILQEENSATSTFPQPDTSFEEIADEWRTVKEKEFVFNNHGVGLWKKAYFNNTELDSTGIIEVDENRQIKVTYQISNDGQNWGSSFTNVENGGNNQYLRATVEYQVYGNNEYGTIGNDKVIVIRDMDAEVATEANTRTDISWEGSTATVSVTTTTDYDIEMSTNGTSWSKVSSLSVPSGTTVYIRLTNGEEAGRYRTITPRKTSNITYSANGGTGNVPMGGTATHGDTVTVLFNTVPTPPSGAEFVGWATSETAGTAEYTNTEDGTKTFTMPAKDVTLYAVWKYAINYGNKTASTVTWNDSIYIGNERFVVGSNNGSQITAYSYYYVTPTTTNPRQSSSAGTVQFSGSKFWNNSNYPEWIDIYTKDSNGNYYCYLAPICNSYKAYLESLGAEGISVGIPRDGLPRGYLRKGDWCCMSCWGLRL